MAKRGPKPSIHIKDGNANTNFLNNFFACATRRRIVISSTHTNRFLLAYEITDMISNGESVWTRMTDKVKEWGYITKVWKPDHDILSKGEVVKLFYENRMVVARIQPRI